MMLLVKVKTPTVMFNLYAGAVEKNTNTGKIISG
jgi:hypothetical protein